MSRSLGPALPGDLFRALSQSDLDARITGGIVYAPAPSLEAAEVQATLALPRREVRLPAGPRR